MANAINLKILEANERIITASTDSRDEFRQRSWRDRRDSLDQPHLDEVPHRLESKTGLICWAVRRRLKERTIPRGLGNTPW